MIFNAAFKFVERGVGGAILCAGTKTCETQVHCMTVQTFVWVIVGPTSPLSLDFSLFGMGWLGSTARGLAGV